MYSFRSFRLLVGLAVIAAPPLQAQGPLAAIASPETTVYGEIHGRPLAEAWPDLALAHILAEPEVREFLQPVASMVGMGIGMGRMQLAAATGLDPETLDVLLQARWAAAWDGSLDPARPGVLVLLDVPGDPDALLDLVEALEILVVTEDNAVLEDAEVDGVSVRRLMLDPGAPEIWYRLDEEGLLVAASREDLAGALARRRGGGPALADRDDFVRARDATWREDSYVFIWVAAEDLLGQLAALDPEDEDLQAMRLLMPYRVVAMGGDPEPPGLSDRIYYSLSPDSPLRAIFLPGPGGTGSQALLPVGSGIAVAWKMEPLRAWDWMQELYQGLLPPVGEWLTGVEEASRDRGGVDLRNDILARLGPESAFYLDFGGSSLLPDTALLIQARDPDGLQITFEALADSLQAHMHQAEYRGHQLYWLELPPVELGDLRWTPRPAWTFTRGWLVVAAWPQVVKKLLAGLEEGTPRLVGNPDFARLEQRFRGTYGPADGWMYLDLVAATRFLLDNGAPLLQALVPSGGGTPLDVARFPTTEVVTRHLFGMYMGSRITEGEFLVEIYSPTGYLGMVLGLSVTAGVAAWQIAIHQAVEEPGPGEAKAEDEGLEF